jgi:phosphodiesterase/alkaline phosphatase D-like protein
LIGGQTDTSANIKAKTSTSDVITIYLNGIMTKSYKSDEYYNIMLTNLSPDTEYNIGVYVGTNLTGPFISNLYLRTTPSVSQSKPFSFVVSSFAYSNSQEVIYDRLNAVNPKFVMMLGNIYSKDVNSENWRDYETEYLKGKISNLILY